MTPLDLLDLTFAALRTRLAVLRHRRGDAGEIVTWVILAAGLALVAASVVLVVGAKLRSKAAGIELQ